MCGQVLTLVLNNNTYHHSSALPDPLKLVPGKKNTQLSPITLLLRSESLMKTGVYQSH